MLTLVGTPIGNLEDLSLRQAKAITSARILLAEDTRKARILLSAIQKLYNLAPSPSQTIVSYYQEVEFEKLPWLIDELTAGAQVALISEAGMPLVSDPGGLLVTECRKRSLPVTVIPGPSAITAALALAGHTKRQFHFLGFLPKKKGELTKLLTHTLLNTDLSKDTAFIAFDSPHRVAHTLSCLANLAPTATIHVCREITKQFEEVVTGTPGELKDHTFKGELVLVITV